VDSLLFTKTKFNEIVGTVLGYGLDDRGSRFTTASRLVLGPTQLPIQGVPGALSLGVKQPGSEADHQPLSSAKVYVL